jgi:hypothetical protein
MVPASHRELELGDHRRQPGLALPSEGFPGAGRPTPGRWVGAAFTRRLPICLRIIALVRDNGAGINIGTEVEEHFEAAAVARFAAGQMDRS